MLNCKEKADREGRLCSDVLIATEMFAKLRTPRNVNAAAAADAGRSMFYLTDAVAFIICLISSGSPIIKSLTMRYLSSNSKT